MTSGESESKAGSDTLTASVLLFPKIKSRIYLKMYLICRYNALRGELLRMRTISCSLRKLSERYHAFHHSLHALPSDAFEVEAGTRGGCM